MTESRPAALLLDTAVLLALGTALLVTAGWGYAERWFGRRAARDPARLDPRPRPAAARPGLLGAVRAGGVVRGWDT
jgi:hypothetical protein